MRGRALVGQPLRARASSPQRFAGRILRLGAVITLMFLGTALGWAGVASAATSGSGSAPTLELHAENVAANPKVVRLVADLSPGGGVATAGVLVDFYIHASQFAGAPFLVHLGSATTDSAGAATFTYEPTWTGRQALVAKARDSSGNTIASAETTGFATTAVHPFAGTVQAVRPDGVIGQWVVGVLLGIIVLVWIALAATVVRVNLAFRGIRALFAGPVLTAAVLVSIVVSLAVSVAVVAGIADAVHAVV